MQQSYLQLRKDIDLKRYIEYKRKNKYLGFLQVAISVRIFDGGEFIPFFLFEHPDVEKETQAQILAESLAPQKIIKYNYTDFYQDVVSLLREYPQYKELPLSEFFIETRYNEEFGRYDIGKFEVDEGESNHPKDIGNTEILDRINGLIREKENADFVQQLCLLYSKLGATELYMCIIGFDEDSKSRSKLTHIISVGEDKGELIEFFFDYIRKCRNFVSLIRTRYTRDLLDKNRYEATKSAKAAIMSRNMSHNLGSHVMAYLKQQLGSVTSIMKEENKVLANLIPDAVIAWNSEKAENVELPFLVGLGRFIGYLQERQDYIATISTDYIPYNAPVNLKDAIYDELNPDLRYLRHKKEPGSTDTKNKPSNILLSYIAKSEGLSRENMDDETFQSKKDIRFGFVDYSEGGRLVFGIDNDGDNNKEAFASSNAALAQMRKINFSLPGGLVGRQAIFSIIENLIRNAAKHGDTSKVTNLDFSLDIIDGSKIKNHTAIGWNEGERVTEKIWRKLYEKANDLDDIYLLTITDNLPCNEKIVTNLKKGLFEQFVDAQTGQMTTANKGIKEMRISAAWLRGETNESLYYEYPRNNDGTPMPVDANYNPQVDSSKKAPLVAVELSAENHLRYIVCVRKNKTVAIVSEVKRGDGSVVASFDSETLKKFKDLEAQDTDRWTIINDNDLKNSKTSYSFILCPDSEEAFNTLRPYTSNRLCRWEVSKYSSRALKIEADKDDTTLKPLMYVYRLFTGISGISENIYIDDERAENAQQNNCVYKKIKFKYNVETIFRKGNLIYQYRTHHSTESNYIAYYRYYQETCKKFKKDFFGCIEGITGDNSSDRLVRREALDEKWYYTHLYALKKKVAIIDERIFKMVHNIDDRHFVEDGEDTILIKDLVSQMDFDELKDIISDKILTDIDQTKKMDNADSIEEVIRIVGDRLPCKYFKSILGDYLVDKKVVGHSHMTPYYHGKAVDIFTIVKDAHGEMALVGCTNTKFNKKKKSFSNTFEKLAVFKRVDNGGFILESVSAKNKKYFADQYDYISIHQGILDKVYENLSIKDNDVAKCRLTECLFLNMMQDKSMYDNYLPRFIIHSGRAKPTRYDMPQEQPFVQYAAIENAVKDCKSMLVELLDFAKYELSNN